MTHTKEWRQAVYKKLRDKEINKVILTSNTIIVRYVLTQIQLIPMKNKLDFWTDNIPKITKELIDNLMELEQDIFFDVLYELTEEYESQKQSMFTSSITIILLVIVIVIMTLILT